MIKTFYFTLVFSIFLIFTSCKTGERVYQNDYIKLTIPESWITIYKDKKENNLWLTISLIPKDDKFYQEFPKDAHVQNLSIVAINSDEMSQQGGWTEFNEYVQKNYESTMKSCKVSAKTNITFKGKKCWFWESIRPKNGIDYKQKIYSFELDKYYITIISTQSIGLEANDIERIIKSIELKM
ncbi:hypothetical protein [Arcicella rigui]|uniref:PsbP C-terminal domain-containing protein n=1 Tax=Arcicella rigui TaxID=797020 RepID=A0ABU5QDR4_9BACT|nr:hypothetical protein [Arcicella rigui]MEA5140707.1 hypothetical protein [Arcicella rigui]